MFKRIQNVICQEIFPGFYADFAKTIIDKNYNSLLGKEVTNISWKINLDEIIEQLKVEYEEQMGRKKTIEDKAKSILAIIGISITAMTFSLKEQNVILDDALRLFSLVLLIISIVYFISATIRAIQAITIRIVHVNQIDVTQTNTTITLKPLIQGKSKVKELLKNRLLNDSIILKQANYASASYTLVRNGIILFAVYFICALSQKIIDGTNDNVAKESNQKVIIVTNEDKDIKVNYKLDSTSFIINLKRDSISCRH